MDFFNSLNQFPLDNRPMDNGSTYNSSGEESSQIWLTLCEYDIANYSEDLWRQFGVFYDSKLDNAVVKRKAEYLAGRYGAKCALDKLAIHKWQVKTGKHRQPLWPDKVTGSITHSSAFAAAAVTNHSAVKGIGIDIEPVMTRDITQQVMPIVMSEQEREYCDSIARDCQSMDVLTFYTLVYSAKEAIFKAWYSLVEQYFDFNAVTLVNINIESKCFSFKVCSPLLLTHGSAHKITGKFELFSGNVLTVVVRTEVNEYEISEPLLDFRLPVLSVLFEKE